MQKVEKPEPEWKPFPGEVCEVTDTLPWPDKPSVSIASERPKISESGFHWEHWRPLSNPLVVQFRPYDGRLNPYPGKWVDVKYLSGIVHTRLSSGVDWRLDGIIGVALSKYQGG